MQVQTLAEVYLFILFIVTESHLVRTRGRNRMPRKAVDCGKSGMTVKRPWTAKP
jgi:hypothetical protein